MGNHNKHLPLFGVGLTSGKTRLTCGKTYLLRKSVSGCDHGLDVMKRSEHMANIITCIRIICSLALLFCPAFSVTF